MRAAVLQAYHRPLELVERPDLRTETHPLEEINTVLDRLRAGDLTGRAVIVP